MPQNTIEWMVVRCTSTAASGCVPFSYSFRHPNFLTWEKRHLRPIDKLKLWRLLNPEPSLSCVYVWSLNEGHQNTGIDLEHVYFHSCTKTCEKGEIFGRSNVLSVRIVTNRERSLITRRWLQKINLSAAHRFMRYLCFCIVYTIGSQIRWNCQT